MSKDNNRLPSVRKDEIIVKDCNEYEEVNSGTYVYVDNNYSGKNRKILGILRNIFFYALKLFRFIFGNLRKFKSKVTDLLQAEAKNFLRRLSVVKSSGFKRKFFSAMAILTIYSALCGLIASKNGSAGEYMKTYFVVLIICAVLIFAAAFLNSEKSNSIIYATLTSILIITGVLLQVMLDVANAYEGLLDLVINMVLGVVVGVIGALCIVFILRSPKKKLFVLLVGLFTIVVTGFMSFFGPKINDASNWAELFGKSLQLSEITKVMAVFVIACIYSFIEWTAKRKIILSAFYLAILSVFFAKGNEFGTVIILVLAYLIISMLSITSVKKFMGLLLWGMAAIFLALGIAKICYDSTYDISAETATLMESIETEAYKAVTGDMDVSIEDVRATKKSYFRQEESVLAPGEDSYLSYSRYIAQAIQKNEEGSGKILEARHVLTVVCKGEKSQELYEHLFNLVKAEKLKLDNNVTIENLNKLDRVNDYPCFSFTIVCKKSIEEYSSVSLIASKIYFKFLERMGLTGSQYHAARIRDALRLTKWLGAEADIDLIGRIPEIESDTIFSYALLQLGLAMVIIIILVYVLKFMLVLFNIFTLDDMSLAMAAIGFSVCISIQSLIQVSMCLDILPIMGMCTAWLSSGGTNFMVNICMTLIILFSMRSGVAVKSFDKSEKV